MLGYIGSFPPPYGGVTIKNSIWFHELKNIINVVKIEVSKKPIPMIYFFIKVLYCSRYIIAVSGDHNRILVTKMLDRIFPWKLRKSIILIMGGTFGKQIAENRNLVRYFSHYKAVFVELESMKKDLLDAGLTNVHYVPNCRKRPFESYDVKEAGQRLKCVTFSMIYPEKGIDLVLETARRMPGVDFFFWGEIKREYEIVFLEQIKQSENCTYCGVYKHEDGEVYAILNQYDLLLFPTRYKNEGMPGTLIESKIAGLPAVVSRWAHNTEMVTHMHDGIVMETNDVEGLINAIKLLDGNRDLLMQMKESAKLESEKYIIDRYINDVVCVIENKDNE